MDNNRNFRREEFHVLYILHIYSNGGLSDSIYIMMEPCFEYIHICGENNFIYVYYYIRDIMTAGIRII